MKKIIALLMAVIMMLSMAACAKSEGGVNSTEDSTNSTVEETPSTVGQILLADFKADSTGTALEIAERLIGNEIIQFMGGAMPIEEGLLSGFDNAEIKGFKEGATFAPMIGSIAFVGYIFELEDGADIDAFKQTLKDSANLRWNICVKAEELIVENEGNKVFFLMCPKSFEESEEGAEDENADVDTGIGDLDTPAEEGITLE